MMQNKEMMGFLICRFFSSLGDQILLFAVPLLIYKATGSIALSGLGFFIEWLPRIISLPFAGALSDKFGGKKIYLAADLIRTISCSIGFLLTLIFPHAIFYTVSLLMGVCAFFYAQSFIALESTIPKLVSHEQLPKAQSIIQGIEQSTLVLGPSLASLAVLTVPITYLLLVAAGVFLLSFLGTLSLKLLWSKLGSPELSQRHLLLEVQTGLTLFFSRPKLVLLTALTIAVNLIWGLALATNAAMVTGIFKQSATSFGLIQTLAGIVAVFSFFLIPSLLKRSSVFSIGIASYLLIVLGGILVGSAHLFYWFAVGYMLILGLDGVFNVYIRTERVKLIPREHLGKTVGVIVLVNQLSLPIAGMLVASLSESIGIKTLFISMSLLALVLLVVFLPKLYAAASVKTVANN